MSGLPKLQSIVAPLAAPIAPAVLLANEIYTVMIALSIPHWIALLSSIVGIVGIDFSGALMCVGAVRAWRRRSWGILGVAVFGAIVYAAIVYAGIASMPNERGRVFGFMIFLTLVAYVGYAIYTLFEEETKIEIDSTNAAIDRMDAERKLTNAQTRQIKATGAVRSVRSVQSNISNIEQTAEEPGEKRITPLGQRIIEQLEINSGRSLREIAEAAGGCSPATVKIWKSKWEQSRE